MRIILSLMMATLVVSILVVPASAENLMNGYVSVGTSSELKPGIEPAGLMIDPVVVRERHAKRKQARAAKKVNSSRTIAIVPFDYKDEYNVGAFDSRRGNMDCSMKGVYARCIYKKQY